MFLCMFSNVVFIKVKKNMFFMFFYLQSNVFNIYVLTNEVDEDDDEYTSLQIYY